MARKIHLSILVLLLVLSDVVICEVDIKLILKRAINELARQYDTTITSGALDSGFCFSRQDYTDNKDKCVDQPTSEMQISPNCLQHRLQIA